MGRGVCDVELSELKNDGAIELNIKHGSHTLNLVSKVILARDTFILIPRIVVQGKTVGFSDECTINLISTDNAKAFMWEKVILKLVRYDGKVYHQVNSSEPGKVFNRRRAFRTYIGIESDLTLVGQHTVETNRVMLKDLSEGGCSFITDTAIDVGDEVRIRFRDNGTSMELSCRIIRFEYKEDLNKTLYACELIKAPKRMGQYLTQKQSEKRKPLYM